MCSRMRDGEVCVRICSTLHEKRSTKAAIGNPGANWTVVGAAHLNDDGKDDILLQGSNTGNLMLDLMNGTTIASTVRLHLLLLNG
jgi:hypothetical protein